MSAAGPIIVGEPGEPTVSCSSQSDKSKCDIVTDLYQTGELADAGGDCLEQPNPKITITNAAAEAFASAPAEARSGYASKLAQLEYDLLFDAPKVGDMDVTHNGVTLRMNLATARGDGLIHFVEGPTGAGFKLESPHEPAKVKPVSAGSAWQVMPMAWVIFCSRAW